MQDAYIVVFQRMGRAASAVAAPVPAAAAAATCAVGAGVAGTVGETVDFGFFKWRRERRSGCGKGAKGSGGPTACGDGRLCSRGVAYRAPLTCFGLLKRGVVRRSFHE